ncbi:MAG TPA: PEGA domain-containing protein [Polyangiaceae bacterium]|nr:PEGA domain-containing protein [Polyangiaceae bacterium]
MRQLSWAGVAATLLLAGVVQAQTPADLARSRDLFRAGASAYAAGDYATAIQALEAAYELTPLPAIAFSLAQAERKQYLSSSRVQHLERAVSLFRRYLDEAPSGTRRGDALEALKQLEPRLPEPQAHPEKPAPVRPTRLMVTVQAPGASVSVDGGPEAPSPLIREVTPGQHRIRASAPGFTPAEREAIAVPGELILTELRLLERPVALTVVTPANAEVYVDSEFAAQSSGKLELSLPPGEHDVVVNSKGHRSAKQRVRLVRGQPLRLRIKPELSTQRVTSLALLCAAGASAGTGLVLSAFAIRSENNAETFLSARSQHNVTTASLAAYQASVNERDRFRFASALSLASAAGLFITGLFLHELDRPRAPERRMAPRAEARLPSFGFVPVAPTGVAGATLHVSF